MIHPPTFTSVVTQCRFAAPFLLMVFVGLAPSRGDDEWPQFRGPGGQGHTDATGLPVTWSETENVRWKTAIPGEGHSSPVISGNQIWLTTALTEQLSEDEQKKRLSSLRNTNGLQIAGALTLHAIRIDRETGELKQQIPLFEVPTPEPKHSLNSYASPTPVIVGDVVYFHFGTYGTAAVNRMTGGVLWKNDQLHVDHQNGPGSSPVVWNDKLIVHLDGIDQQFIVAFDRMTGKVAWQTKRSGQMDPTPEFQKAYGTPLIVETADVPLVISPAANWVYGYDARDGREIWKASYGKLGFSTVPRPVTSGDTVFVATSYLQSRLVAVRFTGEGDVTESHVRWMSDRQIPKKPSLVVSGQRLYLVSDNGIVRCVDTETGEDIWFDRLSGDYSASPLLAEGRLYFFGQNGTATVLEDSGSFQQLAKNQLEDGFMASPAVAGKALFLRTTSHLYRIESPDKG
ncbi:MAG: PQQ-like beta-propeller repeat protein [Planctomycetaceae bacterium]|nr:PQQ-like beta-propeller repeat protein [Planctomycetaceae bacterium]